MKKVKLLSLLVLLMTAATGAWAQNATPTTYKVTMKQGTTDAGNWKAKAGDQQQPQSLPLEGVPVGTPVTMTYGGRLKVKDVTATTDAAWAGDLSNIPTKALEADGHTLIVKDGTMLTGTLGENYKIQIAPGAKVTLSNVNITNLGTGCDWPGISCPGDATLVLVGENNIVCAGVDNDGFSNNPGIWIAPDKTLTIDGDGQLIAKSYEDEAKASGAGIGGGYEIPCGNIIIKGGFIEATGGFGAAGIGSGTTDETSSEVVFCGNISIIGGTITATGGEGAAGIGGGLDANCGDITIYNTVTRVTATKGVDASYSIGKGGINVRDYITCGTVTIDDVEDATTTSTFEHFESTVSDNTWTLTHK